MHSGVARRGEVEMNKPIITKIKTLKPVGSRWWKGSSRNKKIEVLLAYDDEARCFIASVRHRQGHRSPVSPWDSVSNPDDVAHLRSLLSDEEIARCIRKSIMAAVSP